MLTVELLIHFLGGHMKGHLGPWSMTGRLWRWHPLLKRDYYENKKEKVSASLARGKSERASTHIQNSHLTAFGAKITSRLSGYITLQQTNLGTFAMRDRVTFTWNRSAEPVRLEFGEKRWILEDGDMWAARFNNCRAASALSAAAVCAGKLMGSCWARRARQHFALDAMVLGMNDTKLFWRRIHFRSIKAYYVICAAF